MPGRTTKSPAQTLTIDNRTLKLTNLDKPLYPGNGFTKAQVIDYYIRISPYLLPHLKNRPVTLKRYPNGIGGEFFYEKDAPGFTPDWVEIQPVPRRNGGQDIRYILVNNLPTLVWLANLANLEIHPFLHRAPAIESPTSVVFDLDPGEGTTVLDCARVAFLLRDVLNHLGLSARAKVSGSKGLQVYVPLNTKTSYEVTQPFARTIARLLEQQNPGLVISEMAKAARHGKIFIDWSQNSDFKTTVGVYSLRAKRTTPFVSLPVSWEELQGALDAKESGALYWNPEAALARVEERGDLFQDVLTLKQKLPAKFTEQLERFAPKTAVTKSVAAAPQSLKEYEAKRNFKRTPEPVVAEKPRRSAQGSKRRFVVQKHAASHLHYDFRLEMHDVLKSWAVPKGVPFEPEEKRLAMATEDHPMDYLDFEGIIPKGQYGGGTVMVWDIGTYEVIDGNYYKGFLHFHLAGKKLKGEWQIAKDRSKGEKAWSLSRVGKPLKALSAKREDASALTGRSMEEIASAADAVWESNRSPAALENLPAADLQFVEPMQAKLAASLPEGADWVYEIKLDGYRTLVLRDEERVRVLSRNNKSMNARFRPIADACSKLDPGTILDGEVIALDEHGRASFNVLQNWSTSKPLLYYAFDLMAWRGKSLLQVPLSERRQYLEQAIAALGDPVRLLGTVQGAASDLIEAAQEQRLEGFLAKRANSVYEPGKRSGAWVKVKVNQGQELVVGGYKPGKDGFDNLAVGYYDNHGKLRFIGKVKNGFTPTSKQQVLQKLKGLETAETPFTNLPEPKNARRGEALTAEAMKKYRWIRPELVAQVNFTEWTDADHLRHSSFAGLRDDKNPRKVTRERSDV